MAGDEKHQLPVNKRFGKQPGISEREAESHRVRDLSIGQIGDFIKPAAPEDEADLDLRLEGPVWILSLNNKQTEDLVAFLSIGSNLTGGGMLAWMASQGIKAAIAAAPVAGQIIVALAGAAGYIKMINEFGGKNGVEINGVIGTVGVIVTPRVGKFYADLIANARLAVVGRTIVDYLIRASALVPPLAAALNIPVVAGAFSAVAAGTPLGWAIAGGIGLAESLLKVAPDPNDHGAIVANRGEAGLWESFILAQVGDGARVSLLSWRGLFSAQGGGGAGVYGNRVEVGDWETWNLIPHPDGTVSLQTVNGHFLCAERGGGDVCKADRTGIGDWEKFRLINLLEGKVALQTFVSNQFVSVQP